MQKVVRSSSCPPSILEVAVLAILPPSHPLTPPSTGFQSTSITLVLSPLEQPLRHLVLLDDVNVCAPAGQGISVDGVQQGLGDGLEQLLGFLNKQHTHTHNQVSGKPSPPPHGAISPRRTRSGSHRFSHMPKSCSVAVPLTMKSLAKSMQPMLSKPQMKGCPVLGSRPATTGLTK